MEVINIPNYEWLKGFETSTKSEREYSAEPSRQNIDLSADDIFRMRLLKAREAYCGAI